MRTGWAIGIVSLACSAVLAGPLNKGWVAADAKWMVHVDVEAAMGSTVGKCLVEHRKEIDLEPLENFSRYTGLDAFKDIKGVTMYSSSLAADGGVVVVVGTANVEASVKRLAAQDKTVKMVEADGRAVYQWHENGEDKFGCIRTMGEDERMLIVSSTRGELDAAIKVVEGGGESAAKVTEGVFASRPRTGSMVFIAVRGIDSEVRGPKVLRSAREFYADIGEDGEGMFGDMKLKAATAADAKNTADFLRGMVAMAKMAAGADSDSRQLAMMMESVVLEARESDLTATIRVKREKLTALMDEVRAELADQKKKAADAPVIERTKQETPKK